MALGSSIIILLFIQSSKKSTANCSSRRTSLAVAASLGSSSVDFWLSFPLFLSSSLSVRACHPKSGPGKHISSSRVAGQIKPSICIIPGLFKILPVPGSMRAVMSLKISSSSIFVFSIPLSTVSLKSPKSTTSSGPLNGSLLLSPGPPRV